MKLIQPADLRNVFCGLCMGCADVVPGVSGGTVALILGIYLRLVTAISRIDATFIGHLRHGRWTTAAEYLDLRFLVALAGGVGVGIVGMSLIINHLLTDPATRCYTLAVFFGMILASAFLVARLVQAKTVPQKFSAILIGVAAAWASYAISGLHHATGMTPSLPWIFACGAIGICAMILPGISGAMILLVLGVYVHLTDVPKNLLSGTEVGASLTTLVVFAAGCALGLIFFSKILRWLLTRHQVPTMATLCGFMIGALRNLWPFQLDLTPEIEKFKHKTFELVWPDADLTTAIAVILVVAAAAGVLLADRLAGGTDAKSRVA